MTAIIAPSEPRSLEETGLNEVLMRDILLKTMFRSNLNVLSELAAAVALPATLTQELLDQCRKQRLVEILGTANASTTSEMTFQLTDAGKARALDALSQSEYFGAMPVPLEAYSLQVKRQSIRNTEVSRPDLLKAMGELIIPPTLIDQLGPAISAGRSMLMYGPPGNGKSVISNGIKDSIGGKIYVPRAIVYANQVITVYDPIVHARAAEAAHDPNALRRSTQRFDGRYVLCERPTVVTGGELTLDMLDLTFNPVSRTYTAPLQLKATGGIFIVDDLGRQADPPQKLVNRWIVPLEEQRDILHLQSGEKFEVPFDTLVIFSTNFHPNDIFDKAALRRIFFKIKIDGPSQADFLKIFAMVAQKRKLPIDQDAMLYLMNEKYPTIDNVYANYQPVFLIDQILSICRFEGMPPQMNQELINRAWNNLFVKESTFHH